LRFILAAFFAFILLSGCSPTTGTNSYAATMKINGYYYDAAVDVDEETYTIDKEIGKIKKRVDPEDYHLKKDFTSNYLDEGTPVYSSKEDKDVLMVKIEDGVQIFKRR
jgi:hypothetical protein